MLTFRDIVIVGAVVALVLLLLRRQPRGCGCAEKKPAPPPKPVNTIRGCGLIPCGGGS